MKMPVPLTVPNLYKYGFMSLRAVDFLSREETRPVSTEDREVLTGCKELVQKLLRGEEILIGQNPADVHNLRPDDVETFSYFLTNVSQVRSLAENGEKLRDYFNGIVTALDAILVGPAPRLEPEKIQVAREFLSRIAEAMLDAVKENVRRVHYPEPVLPANE
jgi:hypothetical protein